MIMPLLAIAFGLVILVWSADRFVEGSASLAHHLGMPPLLIGMVVVGFGTSAPEMMVSALASLQGSPGIALGNAYGSNITNIALILGLTAIISPVTVQSQVLQKELPILTGLTILAGWQLWNGEVSRGDAAFLLIVFFALMTWTVWQGLRRKADPLGQAVGREMEDRRLSTSKASVWLVIGLVLLILSSRLLVWGAVKVAQSMGLSDLIIGLTIVAIGTSLPELASSLIAARKGEHQIAFGNVLGSNLFNTLAVVGLAGAIHPITVGPEVFNRDFMVILGLTISLFVIGYGFRGPGRINRIEGLILLLCYLGYMAYLVGGAISR